MKSTILTLIACLCILGCSNTDKKESEKRPESDTKNEVLVLGTLHDSHLTQAQFSVDVLRGLIQRIQPDIILTEIPPDRFPIAMKEFQETNTISEPRVERFVEYTEVIFPLSKSMNYTMIPTAGWTKEMAEARSKKLSEISENPARAEEWSQLMEARERTKKLLAGSGKQFDPYWINSNAYDEIAEIELSVYNKLFNEELGLGGWDNINVAHYSHIEKALETYKNQGKRVLITYGAAHKGWFLRELRKRDDITLLKLSDFKEN